MEQWGLVQVAMATRSDYIISHFTKNAKHRNTVPSVRVQYQVWWTHHMNFNLEYIQTLWKQACELVFTMSPFTEDTVRWQVLAVVRQLSCWGAVLPWHDKSCHWKFSCGADGQVMMMGGHVTVMVFLFLLADSDVKAGMWVEEAIAWSSAFVLCKCLKEEKARGKDHPSQTLKENHAPFIHIFEYENRLNVYLGPTKFKYSKRA